MNVMHVAYSESGSRAISGENLEVEEFGYKFNSMQYQQIKEKKDLN
jgi:hypothetical protein